MQSAALQGGFAHAPIDAAHAFRAALQAMARPGLVQRVTGAQPPAPLSVAAGVLVLTLMDRSTPVFLAPSHDVAMVRDWLTFHTGAPLVAADRAVFAIGDWLGLSPLGQFAIGTPEYPDRSATLIVEQLGLERGMAVRLRGPGIRDHVQTTLPDVPALQANAALFPLGCDFYFTTGADLMALPRSTKLEAC